MIYTPAVLTVAQVAEQLGVSQQFVRRLLAQRRIRAVKHGRDWVITQASLKRYQARPPGRRIKGKAIKADSLRRQRDRERAKLTA